MYNSVVIYLDTYENNAAVSLIKLHKNPIEAGSPSLKNINLDSKLNIGLGFIPNWLNPPCWRLLKKQRYFTPELTSWNMKGK